MRKYSLETKLAAVHIYFNGSKSIRTVANKFNVTNMMFMLYH